MFLTNIFGIRFSLLNEFLILVLLSVPLVLLVKNRFRKYYYDLILSLKKINLSLVEKIMVGALVFLIVTSFINTFYWPVHIWDSIVLYDFRAHVFASTGFMKEVFIDSYYNNYPLLTSLSHTIIYLSDGQYPQFLHSFYYLSLGVSFYGLVREFVSRKIGLLFTLVLMIIQPLFYHSLLSLTNLPFSVYLSLGAICIYLWDKKKDKGYLILSALLVALSTWTRSVEPFWLAILLIVFIVSIYRKRVFDILTYSLFFFPIHEIWKVFSGSLNKASISTAGEIIGYSKLFPSLFNLKNWGQVIIYLYKNVVIPWGWIFVVFLISTTLLFFLKEAKKLNLIFIITFSFLAFLFVGTIQLSLSTEYWYRIGDAAQRLSMLFYPLFIYCTVLVVQELLKQNNK
jgi:4-amino-4-deoxy-L-arabinose transferase-like glycosyltransferase